MITLPIRSIDSQGGAIVLGIVLTALTVDTHEQHCGIPRLHGELNVTPTQPLLLTLRVQSRAGIPIIEGSTTLAAGQRHFSFKKLRAFGIEAYAHTSETEQIAVSTRIWTRSSHGTLVVRPADDAELPP